MKSIYSKPEIEITIISNSDVITASGLVYGGSSGKAESESFNSLFE